VLVYCWWAFNTVRAMGTLLSLLRVLYEH